jgi:hypothetical protein
VDGLFYANGALKRKLETVKSDVRYFPSEAFLGRFKKAANVL